MRRLFHGLLPAACLLAGGCAKPTVTPNPALLAEQARPYRYSDADWAAVLREHVRDGLVDYQGLARDREPLERYYALLGQTGPTTTPDQFGLRAAAVAYWINVYNALVLLAVLERYPVESMYELSLPSLEFEYRFHVDGKVRTLAEIENTMLEVSGGDVRCLLATSRAAMGAPRLARQPMHAETLERQLSEAATAALENPNVLRIDHAGQAILVWQLILRRQEDFINYWRAQRRVASPTLFNVLLELASPRQRRRLQAAAGYAFREIAFDRTLNACPGLNAGPAAEVKPAPPPGHR